MSMMMPDPGLMGAPPMMEPPPAAEPDASPAEVIRQMLDLADKYRTVEPDDVDLAKMEKARTLLQDLLAVQQQQEDGLMQGKADPAALRRFGG